VVEERDSGRSIHYGRRSRDAVVAAIGLVVLLLGMVAVRNGTVTGTEEAVFHAVNDLPEGLYVVVSPLQQAGALFVGPVVALGALAVRRYRLAVVVLAATALKLAAERGVKAAVTRERPGTSIGTDVTIRGDVHTAGESFVSGHAALAAALATVVSPYLRGRWKIVPWALVAAVMLGRVYVGAHNPLDVVCGAALGLANGGGLYLLAGVPMDAPRRPDVEPAAAPSDGPA
jgi:membrane-associated phospholipid phosphatase